MTEPWKPPRGRSRGWERQFSGVRPLPDDPPQFLTIWLWGSMRATGGIDAFVGQHEALYRTAVHDVGFDNLFDIPLSDTSVPDTFWIDHHGRAMFALIEASRHVRAHPFFESTQREFLLEEILQLGLGGGVAATARMARFALIAANEQVFLKLGHGSNLQDFQARYWEEDVEQRTEKQGQSSQAFVRAAPSASSIYEQGCGGCSLC